MLCAPILFYNLRVRQNRRIHPPNNLPRAAVLVVPAMFFAPLTRFGVPPLVVLAPAVLASLVQLVTRTLSLFAVPAMVLYRFMKAMICPFCSMLALGLVCTDTWCAGEE